MRRLVRHSAVFLFSLTLGCTSDSQQISGGKSTSSARKRTVSPEAAVILQQLGYGKKTTEVLDGIEEYYASSRLTHLETELRQVDAHLRPDGKIYARDGREVYVYQQSGGYGCHVTEEMYRRDAEEEKVRLQELRKRYTVIELPYFGPLPC